MHSHFLSGWVTCFFPFSFASYICCVVSWFFCWAAFQGGGPGWTHTTALQSGWFSLGSQLQEVRWLQRTSQSTRATSRHTFPQILALWWAHSEGRHNEAPVLWDRVSSYHTTTCSCQHCSRRETNTVCLRECCKWHTFLVGSNIGFLGSGRWEVGWESRVVAPASVKSISLPPTPCTQCLILEEYLSIYYPLGNCFIKHLFCNWYDLTPSFNSTYPIYLLLI